MPTGSPLGVKLMMGFDAVPDPRGLTLPGMPGLTPSPIENMMLSDEIGNTGNKKLVQLGKYSFKTLDESETSETNDDKSENEAEKESISKRPIGGYIALTVFVILVLLVAGNKFCSKKENSQNQKQKQNNEPQTAK